MAKRFENGIILKQKKKINGLNKCGGAFGLRFCRV
jgi:hypothetical protein